jgi:DNA modification methylase
MNKIKKKTKEIYDELESNNFTIIVGDAVKKVKLLKDKSVKLMYGSPPYPNAKRNYADMGE